MAEISPKDEIVAATRGTWRIEYRNGDKGFRKGGGILLQVPPFWGWTKPQFRHPQKPGYTTARIGPHDTPFGLGMPAKGVIRLVLTQQGLPPGSTVVFTYGDTSGGKHPQARATADSYADARHEFIVRTDPDGDGVSREIDEQPWLSVRAREAVRFSIAVSTFARVDEPIRVHVTALDGVNNWDRTYRGTVHLETMPISEVDTYHEFKPQDAGNHVFVVSFSEPGRYRLLVRGEDGLKGRSDPCNVGVDHLPNNLYWGDVHGHSGLSDGTGTPEDYFRYARDVSGLDIAALTDHGNNGVRPLTGAPWEEYVRVVGEFYEPDEFVTIHGYEYTNWLSGHKNIYFLEPPADIKSAVQAESNTPKKLYGFFENLRFMSVPHHPGGGPAATVWDDFIPDHTPLVEISSQRGTSETPDTPRRVYRPIRTGFVDNALSLGHRFGFIGSGDSHNGHPGMQLKGGNSGLMGLWCRELDREAVWNAMNERTAYATTGARIGMTFSLDSYFMGSVIPESALRSPPDISAHIWGTADIEEITLIKNGKILHETLGESETAVFEFTEDVRPRSGSYYYLRVLQSDGEMAWSSPIYIR